MNFGAKHRRDRLRVSTSSRSGIVYTCAKIGMEVVDAWLRLLILCCSDIPATAKHSPIDVFLITEKNSAMPNTEHMPPVEYFGRVWHVCVRPSHQLTTR